jgi:hypothetical protein
MARIGKIISINFSSPSPDLSIESALKKYGYNRVPGTIVYKLPYKEFTGKYRTGLDPDSAYIQRIEDPVQRELEKERAIDTKERLEKILGVDLSPRSDFWDYSKSTGPDDNTHVKILRLRDGVNYFHLDDPWQELAFSWARVHPTIASSLKAYERGEFRGAMFYVADDELETLDTYNRKKAINDAIIKFSQMPVSLKRKVARLMGMNVSEDTKEEVIYNMMDEALRQTEFTSAEFRKVNPVSVFNQIASLSPELLTVKDMIREAIKRKIYTVRANGAVYYNNIKMADSREKLATYLLDPDNQEDLLLLESLLKKETQLNP